VERVSILFGPGAYALHIANPALIFEPQNMIQSRRHRKISPLDRAPRMTALPASAVLNAAVSGMPVRSLLGAALLLVAIFNCASARQPSSPSQPSSLGDLSVNATAGTMSDSSITGKVLDPRGYKPGELAVRARARSTGQEYATTCDADGAFQFPSVTPDAYTIVVEGEGFDRSVSSVSIEAGRPAVLELLVLPRRPLGSTALNTNLDKYIDSTYIQGGRYPAGNISYLNISDDVDMSFMVVYFAILGLLSLYGIYRYRLVYLFLRYRNFKPQPKQRYTADQLPRVTVQLPLFNEMYVAERLVEAVAALDYPRELMEIQVLDDSTDETTRIASLAAERWRQQGVDVKYYHRSDRHGFKAGALEAGLKNATGEFILIFDADFVPRADCIRKMIDYFNDERIGLVQMRWSHINRDYSLLTKIQAIMLDGHFVIEQTARNRCGGFFNFNGTAGMWRRNAIEWSGGWQHDTLAEDTDLSYRAQLMGWRFVYLLDEDVPSELPVEMNAFKSQQRRWAKGLVQVGIKMLGRIWRDPRLPRRVKLEQFFRLTGNLAAPLVIVLALINLPVLIVRYNQGLFHLFVFDVPILTFSTLSVLAFYVVPQWHVAPKTWKKSLKYMPFVMSMGIALTFSNARAVLEALFGVRTPFVRTPKYGIESVKDTTWVKKRYVPGRFSFPIFEVLFALYFIITIWYAVYSHIFGTLPFLLIYLVGYAYAAVMSITQSGVKFRPRAEDSQKLKSASD
jgi:cellulose synthase/poly-beta-1,6-N-acetylglucosamine synthase-like glycosyltransferase